MAMGYISTGMDDRFNALLVSVMAFQLALVNQNPFQPCCIRIYPQNHPLINVPFSADNFGLIMSTAFLDTSAFGMVTLIQYFTNIYNILLLSYHSQHL